jgi:hypothetical protein
MAYVYRHIRLDKNEPFYIGIGKDNSYKRAFEKSKTGRSIFWHNVVNKSNYEVEILIDNLSWQQACEKEKEFILLYGRKDLKTGCLVNMTIGGENPPDIFGDKNPMKRLDVRQKISNIRTGVKLSDKHKISISKAAKLRKSKPPSRKGTKMSKEGIDKMLNSRLENGKLRKKIYQYDLELNLINTWRYGVDIKNVYKTYSIGNIHSVCRKERKIAYGYIWSYDLFTK